MTALDTRYLDDLIILAHVSHIFLPSKSKLQLHIDCAYVLFVDCMAVVLFDVGFYLHVIRADWIDLEITIPMLLILIDLK